MSGETQKMSRVGKVPIALPAGVEVGVDGRTITVKGPKGSLNREIPTTIAIEQAESEVRVLMASTARRTRADHGLARALIQNMVTGVSAGFTRILEVNGVGYRADLKSGHILFQLGHSHPILYQIPSDIEVEISKDNKVTLRSISKESLGHAAARIRSFRPPEPYKGKGIKYSDEIIIRKAGKAAAR